MWLVSQRGFFMFFDAQNCTLSCANIIIMYWCVDWISFLRYKRVISHESWKEIILIKYHRGTKSLFSQTMVPNNFMIPWIHLHNWYLCGISSSTTVFLFWIYWLYLSSNHTGGSSHLYLLTMKNRKYACENEYHNEPSWTGFFFF